MASQERDAPGTAGTDLVALELPEKTVARGVIVSLYRALETIIGLLEGRLNLGTGRHASWSGHVDGQWLEVVLPTADTDFAVPHGLGRVPAAYILGGLSGLRPGAGVWYNFYDSPVNAHTDQILWLRCTGGPVAGPVTARLWVV